MGFGRTAEAAALNVSTRVIGAAAAGLTGGMGALGMVGEAWNLSR